MYQRPDRLSLLGRVADVLQSARIPFAMIGASAMAVHGIVRATADQDLLAVDGRCLRQDLWAAFDSQAVEVEIRRGDFFDPLAGVVRFSEEGQRPVDLVIGKLSWQAKIIDRAAASGIPAGAIPVVRAADLILLKLYAGGPQDAWDIQQILAAEDRESLIAAIDPLLPELPAESAALWRKILES